MSKIEELISEIEEYIDNCKFYPLSNSKIIVNKEELEELLVELRLRTPEEIKKYQKIISNQEAIMNDAKRQANSILAEANAQTNELLNEHEIMQKAYSQANQIVEQAQAQGQAIVDQAAAEAESIRYNAIQYTDDILNSIQNIMQHTMEDAQNRFGSFMNSLNSSYEIVLRNRNELRGEVPQEPEEESSEEIQQQ